jgi:hypothetical protein
MDSIAIGSGLRLRENLREIADWIQFDTFGENKDVFWFRRSVDHYLRESGEASVGGMFLIIKIDARHGMRWFPHTRVDITNKESYELTQQGIYHRWVQRKLSTGEQIELMLPWEVDDKDRSDNRFDGIRPLPAPKALGAFSIIRRHNMKGYIVRYEHRASENGPMIDYWFSSSARDAMRYSDRDLAEGDVDHFNLGITINEDLGAPYVLQKFEVEEFEGKFMVSADGPFVIRGHGVGVVRNTTDRTPGGPSSPRT